ncbi:hypothetical protein M1437_01285 [Patescibacteria group bacterium]|nr:hypothetical protein [Patescibacteria group bacterium]
MQPRGVTSSVVSVNSFNGLGNFLPQFLTGLTLLLLGLIVAVILKELILRFLVFLKIEDLFGGVSKWLSKVKSENHAVGKSWPKIVAELVRWLVVILFLVPVAQVWGLPKIALALNQFLAYIPNFFMAIAIGYVGIVFANLVSEIVKKACKACGSASCNILGFASKYGFILFVVLLVLSQLGVSADMMRILLIGTVGMVAVAGGLAFGLGGRDSAEKVVSELKHKLSGVDKE